MKTEVCCIYVGDLDFILALNVCVS